MSNPYNPQNITPDNSPKRLERSMSDKYIAGVCGGVAKYLGIDATVVRVIFVLLALAGIFPGLLAYIIGWIIMPAEY